MNNEIFEKIKIFINEHLVVNTDEITLETQIENDLGVYGDDAIDLIIAFGKNFNVDVSNFMASDYFSPEGDSIFPAIVRFFTGKKKKKIKELTINQLCKAIISGSLNESTINSEPSGTLT